MRAFVVSEPGRHGLSDVDDLGPGPGEVLVAPVAVGICGSDLELLDGRRPADYVRYPVVPGHEWAGAATALSLARRAGTVLLLGISGGGAPAVDPDVISLNHLRVQGVFAASRAAWQWLVSLYAAGLIDPSPLITHRFGLDRVDDAFAVLGDRAAGAIKVIVEPNRQAAA